MAERLIAQGNGSGRRKCALVAQGYILLVPNLTNAIG